jgi:heptosyltransferase-2
VHARWSRPAPARTLDRYASAVAPLGIPVPATPRHSAGPEAEAWAERWMQEWQPGRAPLGVCPWARHFTKRWPEARWLSLHERLAQAGEWLIYFSLEDERRELPSLAARVAEDSRARWCTESLPRMAALLGRCQAAVCCDSGLMHLAAARGIRVVAMFGSTVPELGFAPAGPGHVVLCRHERCQPCTLHGRPACPKRHFRCMLEIQPEEVAEAIVRVG